MPRGKFNKRGGGPRLDAQNEEEIEIRNAQLAELQERRNARREAEAEDEDDEEETTPKEETNDAPRAKPKATEPSKPAVVTTAADHKRNLAKLAEVRRRREEAEARRQMEEEEEEEREEERKKLAAMTLDEGKKKKSSKEKQIPKLDKITIKKMKPAQMKEALKERGLDIQGNAKALQARLLEHEANR